MNTVCDINLANSTNKRLCDDNATFIHNPCLPLVFLMGHPSSTEGFNTFENSKGSGPKIPNIGYRFRWRPTR